MLFVLWKLRLAHRWTSSGSFASSLSPFVHQRGRLSARKVDLSKVRKFYDALIKQRHAHCLAQVSPKVRRALQEHLLKPIDELPIGGIVVLFVLEVLDKSLFR